MLRTPPPITPPAAQKAKAVVSNNDNGARAWGYVEASIARCRSTDQLRVGSLCLRDFRAELEAHSLLAHGLEECVEALVETEWEGGVDGWVEMRGERVAAMGCITVDALRRRLEEHGLVGSLSELRLLTGALAKRIAADDDNNDESTGYTMGKQPDENDDDE